MLAHSSRNAATYIAALLAFWVRRPLQYNCINSLLSNPLPLGKYLGLVNDDLCDSVSYTIR